MRKIAKKAVLLFCCFITVFIAASCGETSFSYEDVPPYSGEPYAVINGNVPFFEKDDLTEEAFEYYSELDALNRCGPAYANICKELMPEEERGSIGQVKPTGWHTVRYDDLIADKYLYNRCHLIGYQLAGENANEKNLITGTRYLNIEGMLDFENQVADYVTETGHHVLYRVTPYFEGENLVASGVLMEGYSVEDRGEGVCFCVFAYNIQPGITIDYLTGDSWVTGDKPAESEDSIGEGSGYIGNAKSMTFHLPSCPNLPAEKNQVFFADREQAIKDGYSPCGNCKP